MKTLKVQRNKYMIVNIFLIFCLILTGCTKNDGSDITTKYSGEIVTKQPEASGTIVYKQDPITIDASNTSQGYVMISCNDSSAKYKVRIVSGDSTYTYDLATTGDYDVFPLQMGSGDYTLVVYKNTSDSNYEVSYAQEISVSLEDDNITFVYPNLYVWYTNYDNAVKISYDLCADAKDDGERVDLVYNYVVSHMTYDYSKAETVQSGYVPDVDKVLAKGKGICFDYAAITAAMLRAHNIPTRLVMGNLYLNGEDVYHAWNEVYVNGEWIWYDTTFDNQNPQSDYTAEGDY